MFLDDLRKSVKPLLWIVAVGFVASLFFTYTMSSRQQENPLVKVNGEGISYADYVRSYENAYDRYVESSGGQVSPQISAYLRQQVLSQMIGNELLYQQAEMTGLRVSDEELDQQIGRIMLSFGSRENFLRYLDYRLLSYAAFEDSVREQILISSMTRLLRRNISVTDQEVKDYWSYANEQVSISYLYLDPQNYTGKIQVDTQQAMQYYEDNKDTFQVPEKVSVECILVPPGEFLKEVIVTGEEIQEYYEDNPDEFTSEEERRASHILIQVSADAGDEARKEARARIESIQKQLQEGASFEELAREYSEDSGSAEEGGDLGYFAYEVMTPSFSKAAFSLEKIGEISDIVETPYGFHIIELTGIEAETTKTLEEAEGQIVEILRQRETERLARNEITAVYEAIADGTLTFELYADGYPDRVLVTPLFSRWEDPGVVSWNAEFSETAFALEPASMSGPIQIAEGWCIIKSKEKQAAYIPSWEEVEQLAKEQFLQKEAEKLAGERAEQIARQVQEERGSLTAFEQEGELRSVDSLKREDSTEEMFGQDREAFTRVAFGLAPGQTSEAFLLSDGYYVIQLATRMIPWDEFPGQESQFRQSLLTTKREQLISEWFKQVQQQAQIVDNTAAFFPSS